MCDFNNFLADLNAFLIHLHDNDILSFIFLMVFIFGIHTAFAVIIIKHLHLFRDF